MQPRQTVTPDASDDAAASHVQIVEREGRSPQLFAFAKLPHVSASAPQRWVHVAREGVWRGHHSGQEIALTHDVLAGFVARFAMAKNATPGTYGHPQGDDFPASLWILDMELRGSDLWALCEFTPPAVKAIKAAEYRYCSIEFALESVDRESGEPAGPVITKLGLTNIPFIDGLTPITLSLVGASAPRIWSLSAMDHKKIFAAITSALGMGKDAPADQLKAAFDAFLTLYAATVGKPLADVAAPKDAAALSALTDFAAKLRGVVALADAPVMPAADAPLAPDADAAACQAICDKLIEATGLDMAALLGAVEQNLDALVAVLTAAPTGTGLSALPVALSLVQRSNAALSSRVVALSAEVATLTAGNAEREAKIKSDAIAAEFVRLRDVTGHVVEDMRQDFTAYAMSAGIETATKIFSRVAAPPQKPIATGNAAPLAKAPGTTPDELPIDETDPAVRVYRMAYGRGPKADADVRRAIEMSAR